MLGNEGTSKVFNLVDRMVTRIRGIGQNITLDNLFTLLGKSFKR